MLAEGYTVRMLRADLLAGVVSGPTAAFVVILSPIAHRYGIGGLESAFERLHRHGVLVVIGGAQPQPLRTMARAGWSDRKGKVMVYGSFERAVDEVHKAFE